MYIKIKEILEKKGRTMYWLSKETGIGSQSILDLCNNKTGGARFENLKKICEVLECSAGDIFTF